MQYGELIRLYFDRSSALQWYWTVYVVVIGGVLAFSSLRQRPDIVTGVLVTVLYCFFAYKNLGAIRDVTGERHAVLAALKEFQLAGPDAAAVTRQRDLLEPTLVAPPYPGIRNFHVASDALTVAALWAMEWRRWRKRREDRAAQGGPPPQPA
jgi:hypothetical protein